MEKNALLKWKEFGLDDAPSIQCLFSKKEYPNQEAIASYLDKGKPTVVSTSFDQDEITGEEIYPLQEKCVKTNGEFSWSSSLPYYIRRYNLRLPIAFEERILDIMTK